MECHGPQGSRPARQAGHPEAAQGLGGAGPRPADPSRDTPRGRPAIFGCPPARDGPEHLGTDPLQHRLPHRALRRRRGEARSAERRLPLHGDEPARLHARNGHGATPRGRRGALRGSSADERCARLRAGDAPGDAQGKLPSRQVTTGPTNDHVHHPPEALLHRRQFVIGPRFVEGFPSWKRITIGERVCVTAHPDLSTCQVSDGTSSLTLLGYALDPEHWQRSDREILESLLPALVGGRLVPALSRLGGRWVLVADTPQETLVFHDAFGLRQVHYTEGGGERWCAAQPGLLAASLGLAADERALGALGHCANMQFWWPGPRTLYRNVARLVPDHRLGLRTGRVERYWPDEPSRPRRLAEAVEACCAVAQGMFRAAHRRFALAQTITAGWDSRLGLAASRAISPDVLYFTMHYWDMPQDYRDLVVPSRLLPTLGLKHHIVRCPDVMDPAFDPLNCRSLMALLLSVPRELRGSPQYLIHRTAIERMWPEALAAPVNPTGSPTGRTTIWQLLTHSRPYRRLRKALGTTRRKHG